MKVKDSPSAYMAMTPVDNQLRPSVSLSMLISWREALSPLLNFKEALDG